MRSIENYHKEQSMKIISIRAGMLSIVTGGLLCVTGCVIYPNGRVGFVPIVVAAPPPVVVETEPVMIPDGYVWDGYEYVGLVGDQYYYLGPGSVWLLADPFRLERF